MPIPFPQTELPRSVSGGSDLWDDAGAGGQLLRGEYLAPPVVLLVGASSQQANSASAAAIVQPHRVTAANSVQANAASPAGVSQPKFVTAANSIQANHAPPAQVHAQRHYSMRVDTESRTPGAMVIGDIGAALVSIAPSVQANNGIPGTIYTAQMFRAVNSIQVNVTSSVAVRSTHLVTSASSTGTNTASLVSAGHVVIGTTGNSMRVATGPLIAGAMVVGDAGHGVLGSEIPSSGDNGSGYLFLDLDLPVDANTEIRGEIVTWPSAGTLIPNEDSSFDFIGPVGHYTFEYLPYVAGEPLGSPIEVGLTVYLELLAANSVQSNIASTGSVFCQLPDPHMVTGSLSTTGHNCSIPSIAQTHKLNVVSASSACTGISAALRQTHKVRTANSNQGNSCIYGRIFQQNIREVIAESSTQNNSGSLGRISSTQLITSLWGIQNNSSVVGRIYSGSISYMYAFSGSAWVKGTLKRKSNDGWDYAKLRRWTGSTWV